MNDTEKYIPESAERSSKSRSGSPQPSTEEEATCPILKHTQTVTTFKEQPYPTAIDLEAYYRAINGKLGEGGSVRNFIQLFERAYDKDYSKELRFYLNSREAGEKGIALPKVDAIVMSNYEEYGFMHPDGSTITRSEWVRSMTDYEVAKPTPPPQVNQAKDKAALQRYIDLRDSGSMLSDLQYSDFVKLLGRYPDFKAAPAIGGGKQGSDHNYTPSEVRTTKGRVLFDMLFYGMPLSSSQQILWDRLNLPRPTVGITSELHPQLEWEILYDLFSNGMSRSMSQFSRLDALYEEYGNWPERPIPFDVLVHRKQASKKEAGLPYTTEVDPNDIDPHTKGAKMDAGKNRLGLVLGGFSRALEAVGDVGTYGAAKYSPNGWESVPDGIERYTDAMLRHHFAEGREELDPESGLMHAAQVAWNSLARLEKMLRKGEKEITVSEVYIKPLNHIEAEVKLTYPESNEDVAELHLDPTKAGPTPDGFVDTILDMTPEQIQMLKDSVKNGTPLAMDVDRTASIPQELLEQFANLWKNHIRDAKAAEELHRKFRADPLGWLHAQRKLPSELYGFNLLSGREMDRALELHSKGSECTDTQLAEFADLLEMCQSLHRSQPLPTPPEPNEELSIVNYDDHAWLSHFSTVPLKRKELQFLNRIAYAPSRESLCSSDKKELYHIEEGHGVLPVTLNQRREREGIAPIPGMYSEKAPLGPGVAVHHTFGLGPDAEVTEEYATPQKKAQASESTKKELRHTPGEQEEYDALKDLSGKGLPMSPDQKARLSKYQEAPQKEDLPDLQASSKQPVGGIIRAIHKAITPKPKAGMPWITHVLNVPMTPDESSFVEGVKGALSRQSLYPWELDALAAIEERYDVVPPLNDEEHQELADLGTLIGSPMTDSQIQRMAELNKRARHYER